MLPIALRVWWGDNRGKLIVTLILLWVATLFSHFRWGYVQTPIVALVGTILFDICFSYIRKRQVVVTLSSWVTGLLIGLVFDPTAGIVSVLGACALAAASKQFLAWGDHRHIFNPAVFGILVSSIIFDRPVSWWAAAWGLVPAVIIVIGTALVLQKLRRIWIPLTFLVTYFVGIAILTGVSSAFRLTIDGTVFLFAFVMLPEPITSLSGSLWRYTWGVLVGGLVIAQSMLQIYIGDPLMIALLTANLGAFLLVRKPFAPAR